ncbi:MAG TPA: carboxylesterase/lipase family protein [Kofleriaceae bacterium]
MTNLVVETRTGEVRGKLYPGADAALPGVSIWKCIPYAEPPVGSLRFMPPRAARSWTGERDATRFGAVAVQSRDPRIAMLSGVGEKIVSSEDCLTLNVYSPAADGKQRPVVVWIHGGAFVMGSGSTPLYDGASFASRHDLVVVTINYRLGILGLLYLGDLIPGREQGNYALLDQIAALRWVQDNIAAFGGDPHQVTVMGESAGAISIGTLIAMPAARGLFKRAILQSGASPLSPQTRDDATKVARRVVSDLGVAADALSDVPVDRLLAVQERVSHDLGLAAFAPYIDEVTLPRAPIESVRAGETVGVPMLLGSNRDEWTLFDVFMGAASVEGFKAPLRAHLGDKLDEIVAAYRGDRSEHRAWVDLVGDIVFRLPMIRLAETHADRGGSAFVYRFDWATPAFDGRLGAAHALELPFVWNRLDLPASQILLGADAAAAQPLATQMQATWAAFIRGGDPNGAGLPAWPRYDSERRATMIVDREPCIVDDPAGTVRALWAAHY